MAHIIVTGTSRGIGFETARILADAGHSVLALSRNPDPISNLGHPNITTLAFDIGDYANYGPLRTVLGQWETVDVLIHNAGSLMSKPFLETTPDDFRAIYEVNVFGVAELTRLVLPKMGEHGHVVTISSMGGVQGSVKFGGLSAYSSSKGAVVTLTELWAEEFKATGPSFNVLALGAVQTEMLEEAFPGYKAPLSARDMGEYIAAFALTGHKFYNGKLLPVSKGTP